MNRLRAMFEFDELDLTPRGILEFFIRPTEGYPAAALRLCMGLFGLWKGFGNWVNLDRYFAEGGLLPWRHVSSSELQIFSILAIAPENRNYVAGVLALQLAASLTLLVGLRSRLSALIVFLVSVALMHRNPFIDNRGDHLYVLIMGLCVLLPLGNVWSLDAVLRARRGLAAPPATMWSQRLMALQVSYIYLYAFGVKFRSPGWHDGSALYHTFASPALVEWPVEITSTPVLLAISWGTILLEMLFPILVWNRPARGFCLIAGALFHLGIELTMRIPVFSTLMVVTYISFLTDDEIKEFLRKVGLGRIVKARERTAAGAGSEGFAPLGRKPAD